MNKIMLLLTGLVIIFSTAFRSGDTPVTFKDQLEKSGMIFRMPEGFTQAGVIANSQMTYDYAIRHTQKQFEVRFALRPLGDQIQNFNTLEKNKKPGDINISPNKLYEASLQAIVLNISGGRMPKFQQFPTQAVKTEFNADWGATTVFEPVKAFGGTYKYCMVVAVHKDNLADAYYFYLADKQETINELIEPVFHCLKFK
ncbi:hypothetical protein EON73_05380 [bacterium]|nr:MAG: hypothetical protein EON73_05380 [bacterium]